MINPFKEVQWNPGLREKRAFARSLVIGFPCIALVFLLAGWARSGHWDASLGLAVRLAGGGVVLGVCLWCLPGLAKPVYLVWYFLGCCIGFVVSNLLLSLLFFLWVTPSGWLRRTFGTPALRKTFDKRASTYWKDIPPTTDPKRYYKQF